MHIFLTHNFFPNTLPYHHIEKARSIVLSVLNSFLWLHWQSASLIMHHNVSQLLKRNSRTSRSYLSHTDETPLLRKTAGVGKFCTRSYACGCSFPNTIYRCLATDVFIFRYIKPFLLFNRHSSIFANYIIYTYTLFQQ